MIKKIFILGNITHTIYEDPNTESCGITEITNMISACNLIRNKNHTHEIDIMRDNENTCGQIRIATITDQHVVNMMIHLFDGEYVITSKDVISKLLTIYDKFEMNVN